MATSTNLNNGPSSALAGGYQRQLVSDEDEDDEYEM